MVTCPMCKKKLRGVEKECPACRTNVELLRDYVQELRDGLVQAEAHTRAGQLGDAIWAYLAVLEVDPDNAAARRQVGQVVTAVRQFDKEAPGRRFAKRLHKQTRFRRFMANLNDEGDMSGWVSGLFWFILVLVALVFGYILGQMTTSKQAPPNEPVVSSLVNYFSTENNFSAPANAAPNARQILSRSRDVLV